MKSEGVISTAVAPVHREADFKSEMITQCLMWEPISIMEKQDEWWKIRMEDGYEGWIHNFYLTQPHTISPKSLTITNRCAPIRAQRGKDSPILAILSFGTIVPVLEETSGYCCIQLINGEEGFISSQNKASQKSRNDIIKLGISLMDVPYLWGGKSSFGYDCSGYVQMVLKTAGVFITRDTGTQFYEGWLKVIKLSDAQKGDLIFFSENNRINHVGFALGNGKIIHCSGKVKIESIIKGEHGFNKSLSKLDVTVNSISKKVDG